jgi:hypothetical protein
MIWSHRNDKEETKTLRKSDLQTYAVDANMEKLVQASMIEKGSNAWLAMDSLGYSIKLVYVGRLKWFRSLVRKSDDNHRKPQLPIFACLREQMINIVEFS